MLISYFIFSLQNQNVSPMSLICILISIKSGRKSVHGQQSTSPRGTSLIVIPMRNLRQSVRIPRNCVPLLLTANTDHPTTNRAFTTAVEVFFVGDIKPFRRYLIVNEWNALMWSDIEVAHLDRKISGILSSVSFACDNWIDVESIERSTGWLMLSAKTPAQSGLDCVL